MEKKHLIIILLSLILTAPGLRAQADVDTYFGLPGSYNSWNTENPASNPYCAKIDENGKAILRDVDLSTVFKVVVFQSNGKDGASKENNYNYGNWYSVNPTNSNYYIKLLENTPLVNNTDPNSNITLTDGGKPGDWDKIHDNQTFNVEFERDNNTLKLTIYPTVYIIGAINGGKWSVDNYLKMEYVGNGEYTLPNVTIADYFSFVTGFGDDDNYNTYRIFPSDAKKVDSNEKKSDLKNGVTQDFEFAERFVGTKENNNSWKTPNTLSNYKVTLNLNTPSVLIEDNGSIPPVPSYTHIYMSTNVSGNSTFSSAWKHGIELAKGSGKVYTGIVKAENNTHTGNYVYFFDKKVSEWPKDKENGYGAGTDNITVENGVAEGLHENQPGYFKLPEAGTYFVKFDLDKKEVSFTKDTEGDFIYFNVGQTYYSLSPWKVGNDWKTPYAFFEINNEINKEGIEMQLIDAELPLFRAKIPAGATGLSRVCTYNNYNAVGNDIAYTRSGDGYAPTDWDKYIYVADVNDDGNTIFVQSHIGINKYYDLRANRDMMPIYILGLKGWASDKSEPNDIKYYTIINSNEGVFIESIKNSTTFKMSYISPLSISNSEENSTRLWADFNLGLIGPNLWYYEQEDETAGTLNKKAIAANMKTEGRINNVQLELGSTLGFNTYNQYNWWINEDPGDYWLVVDLDYHTATLLNFKPLPELEINSEKTALKIEDLSDETNKNAEIEDIVVPGSDETDTTGANIAHFRYVNSLSATGTLTPPNSGLNFFEKYTAEYDLSYNNESVGMFEPTDASGNATSDEQSITVNTVVPETEQGASKSGDEQQPQEGEDGRVTENKFTARGYYTSKDRYDVDGNNLVFRSWTAYNDGTMEIEHKEPEEPKIVFFELYNSDSEDGYYDALIGISYNLPHRFVNEDNHEGNNAASISIYPTFEVYVEADGQTVPAVITPNTDYIKNHSRFLSGKGNIDNYKDEKFCEDSYVFPEVEETNIGVGSWVYRSINTSKSDMNYGYLPLYAPSVVRVNYDKTKPITVTAKIIGMYPYRVYANNNISITNEQLSFSGIRLLAETSEGASRIVTVDMPSPTASVQIINISDHLTGVEDIDIDEDTRFDLYNLQGVRIVDENPAPGIYIQRYSNGTAKKIFIR